MRASLIARAPKSANHELYHLAPQGFWAKFRNAVVVNPEISSGLPLPDKHRYPQPGSRTERYATPATQSSDIAFNPYYKRDVRRKFPKTSVISQETLTGLLLASPEGKKALPSPSSSSSSETAVVSTATDLSTLPSLVTVLKSIPNAFSGGIEVASSEHGLPPKPPSFGGKKWRPVPGEEVPHDENAYWPMVMVK